MITICCWLVFGLGVLTPFATISSIGKPRTPLGRDDAAMQVLVGVVLVAVALRALGKI